MSRHFIVIAAVLVALGVSVVGQSKPSIQGVWRAVEVTITNPNPASGALPKGTHTNVQPSLLIITGKHYSTIADNAAKPRPTAPFKVPGKPTAEEMQAQWGPFAANAGTYEVSGNTVTARPLVAKNAANQASGAFARYTFKLDGTNLWSSLVETQAGKVEYPGTVKYVRVE